MKLSQIEKQYKDFIHKSETEISAYYDELESKSKVWNRLMEPKQKLKLIPIALAAASVTLLLMLWFTKNEIREKDQTIAQLTSELHNLKGNLQKTAIQFTELEQEYIALKELPSKVDTIYKTKIIYEKIMEQPEQIVINDYEEYEYGGNQHLLVSKEGMFDLAGNQTDIKSINIKYGEKTKDGITPWAFTVKYQ